MQTQSTARSCNRFGIRHIASLLAAITASLMPAGLHGQTGTWDPNPESDIAGYTIYVGTTRENLTAYQTVGKDVSSHLLTGLAPSTTYYCSIEAFSTTGVTSEKSPQITFTTPAASASAAEIALNNAAGTEIISDSGGVSFGTFNVGSSSWTETITITNEGFQNLTGLTISSAGLDSQDFMVSSLGATSLAPGTSTTFDITFVPSGEGTRSATLSIASNDADENPFIIALVGTGSTVTAANTPEITVTLENGTDLVTGAAGIEFGSLNPGVSGLPKIFSLRNTGASDLTGIAVSVSGSHAADFSVSAPGASTLAAGESTTFSVVFKPGSTGTRGAVVHISSNDADENPFDIALAGTGLALPEIAVAKADGTNLTDGAAALAFGSLNLGPSNATQSITIKNPGTAALSGLALTVDGSHAADFSVSSLSSSSLAPGASATFTVTFKPNAAGSRSAALHIASNDADENPFDIALAGTGVALSEIAVEKADGTNLTDGAAALAFGSLNLGPSTTTQSITIKNPGTAALSGLALTVDGSHAADFSISSLSSSSLAPGASATFTVTFKPNAAGSRSAALHIASNDADENPFDITLAGTGLALPEIAVEKADATNLTDGTAALAFGSLNLGPSNSTQSITIKNPGTATLSGLALTVDGSHAADFSVSSLSSSSLAPGASATFTVTFKPNAAGSRSAALHIASNDADENPFDIALAGTGVALPEIAVEKADASNLTDGAAALAFGSLNLGPSNSTQSITIKNPGTAALSGLALTVDGSHAADFSVSSLSSSSLAPGASATFTVTFKPNAAGSRSAALHIASNDADENPFDIALAGTGVALPEIAVEKTDGTNLTDGITAVSFGSVVLGATGTSQGFTIRNTGSAVLSGLALAVNGSHTADFSVSSLSSSSLAPGASATFAVTFKPGGAGSRSAVLRIASNDADENPFDVTLTGNGGVVPEIAVEDASGTNLNSGSSAIAFGSVNLQSPAATHLITIRNLGSAALTGISHSITGGHAGDFSTTSAVSATLAPGESSTITISFKPGAAGNRSASLRVTSNDGDENPFIIPLTGSGVALPEMEITGDDGGVVATGTPTRSFGTVEISRSSSAIRFSIQNTGTADLADLSVTAIGGHAADFIVTGPENSVLAPGASSTFQIVFRPKATGTRSASLRITSNDADESPFIIPVTGAGIVMPEIVVTSGSATLTHSAGIIDFGSADTRTAGAVKTFTIRNAGTADLTGLRLIRRGIHPGDFTVSSLEGNILPAGKSTTFRVSFSPGDSGLRNAALRITSNDSDEGAFDIALAGRGIPAPDIDIRVAGGGVLGDGEAFVSFGNPGMTRTFTVTNRGSAALTGLRIEASGLHAADFANSRIKAKSLAPGKSTTFKVTFNPGSNGTRWAAVKIISNDPDTRVFDIVLTGKNGGTSSSKSAPVEKPSATTDGGSLVNRDRPVISVMTLDGQKYRCITIPKTRGNTIDARSVEVSGNLVDWSSGAKHTTVVRDNERVLKVRDNTPITPGSKRHIRLKKRG